MKVKQDSKEAIYEGVLNLLDEVPILDLSVSKLKKHTGLSTGTFYYHFPNGIEDIFKSLFVKLTSRIRNEVYQAAISAKTIDETLDALVTTYFNWHKNNLRESSFFWRVSESGFSEIRHLIQKEYRSLSTKIYEVLCEQGESEGVKVISPNILDAFLYGAARELIHSWIGRGRREEEFEKMRVEFIDALHRACIDKN
ncbi:TetR/AcrR family transcriptional regulator [Halobacteriovorax vibrionivorans]|uniref:TetR/AcrR family transcriptional regulator n=1 Tax=Halobacteriovorax vibrionivorans TaxID=2152716 RepID=A0ABY0IF66_9BACT|nr:TetR/AcrR family transcriptional regulator [Halobacteriovorax vibrionivorans]TGD49120.1 TetR/AcrR family transcriptional regulator [Halobacteriovorax sp. Y22]